jgi:hypothetical protein
MDENKVSLLTDERLRGIFNAHHLALAFSLGEAFN